MTFPVKKDPEEMAHWVNHNNYSSLTTAGLYMYIVVQVFISIVKSTKL